MTDKTHDKNNVHPFVNHKKNNQQPAFNRSTLSVQDKVKLVISFMGQPYTPSKSIHAEMFIRHWEVNRTFKSLLLYIAEITGQTDRLWTLSD